MVCLASGRKAGVDLRLLPARAALLGTAVLMLVGAVACSAGPEAGEQVSFDTVDGDPDWSPDGRLIAFVSSRGGGGIYVIHSDGRGLRRLVRAEASDVDWSPDGSAIAFAEEDGIYVMSVKEGGPRRILRGNGFSHPVWAVDGRRLAVVKEEPDLSTAIYMVLRDGRGKKRLLPRNRRAVGAAQPGSIAAVSETEPSWSPDGRRIAFQAADGHVVVARIADGFRREIAGFAAYEPAWSPDGKLIAYQCEGDVCVANAEGSRDPRRVASDGGDPSWAPDSRRLVFEHYLYGGTGYFSRPQSLSTIDVGNGHVLKLTFGPNHFSNP
jgi:Tol biopolymer transport system component